MKNKFKGFVPVLAILLLLSGCSGLEKMKKNAGLIRFKVTPELLESRGDTVDVAINGIFPAKYFDRKSILVAAPVLRYSAGESSLKPVTLQGEKVKANNREISYLAGGNFSYRERFEFTDPMRLSDLEIHMQAARGKKSVTFDPVVIARGILATHTLMETTPKPLFGIQREANNSGRYNPALDPFQRVVPDEMIADILYLINSASLRDQETKSSDVRDLIDYTRDAHADDRKEIKKVEVSAYASPDGSIDINLDLASRREKASTAFLEDQLKEAAAGANLRSRYTPEDWEGFKEMLERSDIQDKDLIMRVLSMYTDPEVREREIRNLSAAFTQVKDEILPKLRRAKLLTSVNVIGKTDEEIIGIAETNPTSLNQAELLHAATLSGNPGKKLALYKAFSGVFPDDWRGFNNQAAVLIGQRKFAEAKPLLEKASALKGNEPIVRNNAGALALAEGDLNRAAELFGAASGSGSEVNYNLGLVELKKGDYNRANQYFRNQADANTALVKLLSGNYNGALADLEEAGTTGSATAEYLKAVIGARTGNQAGMLDGLRKAVSLDSSMKEKARTDLEFNAYFSHPQFREIVD